MREYLSSPTPYIPVLVCRNILSVFMKRISVIFGNGLPKRFWSMHKGDVVECILWKIIFNAGIGTCNLRIFNPYDTITRSHNTGQF